MSPQMSTGAVLYAQDVSAVSAFYSALTGLAVIHAEDGHTILAGGGFQLVVLSTPITEQLAIADPPVLREDTAVKLAFVVPDLAAVRTTAPSVGGALLPADREWEFRGQRICDGRDPEGNVVQFRQPIGH